jgi:hypothetical protein
MYRIQGGSQNGSGRFEVEKSLSLSLVAVSYGQVVVKSID